MKYKGRVDLAPGNIVDAKDRGVMHLMLASDIPSEVWRLYRNFYLKAKIETDGTIVEYTHAWPVSGSGDCSEPRDDQIVAIPPRRWLEIKKCIEPDFNDLGEIAP